MKRFVILLPILAGMLWGTTGSFVRIISAQGANTITVLASRLFFSLVILTIVILFTDRSLFKVNLKDIPILCGTGLIGVLGLNYCYNTSINLLTLSFSSVLITMAPIFTLPISAICFKEKITLKKLICLVMAVSGCVMLSGILEPDASIPFSIMGIIAGLFSALFYSLMSIFSKQCANRGYKPITITFYSSLAVTIFIIPFADWGILFGYAFSGIEGFIVMISQALFLGVISYLLFNKALQYIPPGEATILATTEPVTAAVLGAFFYNEIPTVLSFLGLVICILAIIILSLPQKDNQE